MTRHQDTMGGHDTWHDDVPVDPIRNVEGPVRAKGSKVMRSDSFGLACALEEEQLRQDGDGLKEDGEGPQELGEGEPVVENEREERAGSQEVFRSERVYRRVMRWPTKSSEPSQRCLSWLE